MRRRNLKLAATAVLLTVSLVLGSTVVGVSRASSSPPACLVIVGSRQYCDVTGVNYAFMPDLINNLSLSTSIQFNFTDAATGGVAHTFTILGREGVPLPYGSAAMNVAPSAVNAAAYNRTYPNLVNINASTTGTFSVTITTPATPGWYQFVCTEPGHYESSMYGFISFGEDLPANVSVTSPSTGPGTAVFIIVGTIVTLTVLAIVLGFVIGRRRGDQFEMPPERLGYPEPSTPGESPPLPPGGTPPTR
jgi:uncharacterized cupredoxin-like copper-binding protein